VTWWGWLLLWVFLVGGGVAVHFLLGRRLWRQVRVLTREMGAAADRFAAVSDHIAGLEAARLQGGDTRDGVGSPVQDRSSVRVHNT